MSGRIMSVDPGEKRIGIAISDETCTLARGLTVVGHVSMKIDCQKIIQLAKENDVSVIIVGNPINEGGEERPQNRHALRMAETIAELSGLRTVLWDESGSTKQAQSIRRQMGGTRDRRSGHLDEVAAALILQSWMDTLHEDEKYDAS
jgi:putative Holliday junction resolvase